LGEITTVAEGPGGSTVLRGEGSFSARIDLAEQDIEPREFDLITLQLKADARATVRVSLENYPQPGQLSHWYLWRMRVTHNCDCLARHRRIR
jgi:hypothetical protein